eukprot:tig00000382_g24547.t1
MAPPKLRGPRPPVARRAVDIAYKAVKAAVPSRAGTYDDEVFARGSRLCAALGNRLERTTPAVSCATPGCLKTTKVCKHCPEHLEKERHLAVRLSEIGGKGLWASLPSAERERRIAAGEVDPSGSKAIAFRPGDEVAKYDGDPIENPSPHDLDRINLTGLWMWALAVTSLFIIDGSKTTNEGRWANCAYRTGRKANARLVTNPRTKTGLLRATRPIYDGEEIILTSYGGGFFPKLWRCVRAGTLCLYTNPDKIPMDDRTRRLCERQAQAARAPVFMKGEVEGEARPVGAPVPARAARAATTARAAAEALEAATRVAVAAAARTQRAAKRAASEPVAVKEGRRAKAARTGGHQKPSEDAPVASARAAPTRPRAPGAFEGAEEASWDGLPWVEKEAATLPMAAPAAIGVTEATAGCWDGAPWADEDEEAAETRGVAPTAARADAGPGAFWDGAPWAGTELAMELLPACAHKVDEEGYWDGTPWAEIKGGWL